MAKKFSKLSMLLWGGVLLVILFFVFGLGRREGFLGCTSDASCVKTSRVECSNKGKCLGNGSTSCSSDSDCTTYKYGTCVKSKKGPSNCSYS